MLRDPQATAAFGLFYLLRKPRTNHGNKVGAHQFLPKYSPRKP